MNVVKGEKRTVPKSRNELVRKDVTLGIRGSACMPAIKPYSAPLKGPRYQFSSNEEPVAKKAKKFSMGPPLEPPKSSKRKIINSTSSRVDSSSSGIVRATVLASDSANDFCTPRNRPNALRYISSSSRGGHSGTRSARSSTTAVEASVVLAISEGRGLARGEIGMAAVDLRHPHLVLCQFSDTLLYTHTMTKINYFNPVEIILPSTFCESTQPNQLYQQIKEHFPAANLSSVKRKHFNEPAGRQQIQELCAPQYSAVYLQVLHKFYALTAAAAVLKYVEYIQCIVFARESLKIEYHSSENTMIIDVGTATQLELVQPLSPSAGHTCCLLGVLGPTYTVGGIRALRAAILQPSCNREFIENRLDAVQDLIENDNGLLTGVQDVIKKLSEVDKILFLCVEAPNQSMDKFGEAQLNQMLLLKTTMDAVPQLVDALNAAECGRLKKIKLDFENPHYKEIADRIRNIIQEDAHLEKGSMGSLQRCFAVKPDTNGLLDVARRTYSELIEDIQKIVEQLSESYDLPLRLHQNVMKGFHIVLPVAPKNRRNFNVEDLPDVFIQVKSSGASVTMSTEELVVLDQQAKESLNEIQKMSNIVISGLLKDLRPFMSSLYKLCENVAELDILIALAMASSVGSYIRPDFNNYLDVKNSVHPLLDYNSQTMPVPNDINASAERNFTIVTGPNMGGKSIYIKQIATLQIMAQLGCFLPATNAVLRLCDRLFSRIGFNDSVELNASTYVLEMKEIQHILKSLTSSSLVIIDELCRGTCAEEGTSIAWAICEELIASDAFTFFTTHFTYLTRLQDLYFNVVNLHTAVSVEEISDTQDTQKRLVYQHKIEAGTTQIKHYGLALASKTSLPTETVNLAQELAELIVKFRKPQEIRVADIRDEKLLYDLNAQIRKVYRKNANAEEIIKQIISNFKNEHPELIEKIRKEKEEHDKNRSKKDVRCADNMKEPLSRIKDSEPINTRDTKLIYSASNDSELESSKTANKSSSDKYIVKSSNELLNSVVNDINRHIIDATHSDSYMDTDNNNIPSQNISAINKATFQRKKAPFPIPNEFDATHSDSYMDTDNNNIPSQNISAINKATFQRKKAPLPIPNEFDIGDEDQKISLANDFAILPDINVRSYLEHHEDSEPLNNSATTNRRENQEHIGDDIQFSDDDSDIAEALTQVLDEIDQDTPFMNRVNENFDSDSSFINDSKESAEVTSIDEELMQETVNEINDELMSTKLTEDENDTVKVLPPPIGLKYYDINEKFITELTNDENDMAYFLPPPFEFRD